MSSQHFSVHRLSSVVLGDPVMPKVRPYKRKKPGGKRKTVHVKAHYRRKPQ